MTVPTLARHATITTPPGPFTVIVDRRRRAGRRDRQRLDRRHRRSPARGAQVAPAGRERAVDRLKVLDPVEAFFSGDVAAIDEVVVRQRSGPFLQEAWEVLRTVPAGHPDTYAAFAARCGRPAAVRAAANACARNAAALFVPCHRVLGSDGGLGGFRWGTPVKRWLLDHEAACATDA